MNGKLNPNFACIQKTRTKRCRQNIGITPPKRKNLFEIFPGGPSGGFCFAKSGLKILLILVTGMAGAWPATGQAEELTFGSTIPSAFEQNETKELNQLIFLAIPGGPGACSYGKMRLNGDNLEFCNANNEPEAVENVWTQEDQRVFLTDPLADTMVGVGTETPSMKLTLSGDGGILAKGIFGAGTLLPETLNEGAYLIWYPRKAAFLAGDFADQISEGSIWNYSVIAGGSDNGAGAFSTVGGGVVNYAYGTYASINGGSYNRIAGDHHYGTISGGNNNLIAAASGVSRTHSTISGGKDNFIWANYSVTGGGGENRIGKIILGPINGTEEGGQYNAIGGGRDNFIEKIIPAQTLEYSAIGGGQANGIGSSYSFIGGGAANMIFNTSDYSAIVGGATNYIYELSPYAFIGGGYTNQINPSRTTASDYATITGGLSNMASGIAATVSGGSYNKVNGNYAVVAGGGGPINDGGGPLVDDGNRALANYAVVSGGNRNTASGAYSVVMGGFENTASAPYATVMGGNFNRATAEGTLVGGINNLAPLTAPSNAILGGRSNFTNAIYAVVAGGFENRSEGRSSAVAGGQSNEAIDDYSGVLGGRVNKADANYSVILGGENNSVNGVSSGAAGKGMNVGGARTFVWGVSDAEMTTTASDAFIIRTGNVGIGTTNPQAPLDVAGPVRATLPGSGVGVRTRWRASDHALGIGADLAENFDTSEEVGIGDCLVIDSENPGHLRKSRRPYEPAVVGIVSTAPAILFEGPRLIIAPEVGRFERGTKAPVALQGRIPAKVSLENGPIEPGDFLTASSTPGHVMKATDRNQAVGAIVGKALDSFEGGENGETTGLMLILATLQ